MSITLELPEGAAVGLRHWHAVDNSREDISTRGRQFMVSAFYPASPLSPSEPARLLDLFWPHQEAALRLLEGRLKTPQNGALALVELPQLELRAGREQRPLAGGPYPVLIYYPGGQGHRLSNAGLCEQLAARGYAVFCLDAPRDAPLVAFPDGTLVTQPAPNNEGYIWPRVADVRFLLDQLPELNREGALAGLLDLNKIGMLGASRGGYLSNICAVEDNRLKAAVNMDGFLWGLWTQGTGLKKYSKEFQQRARALQTPILRLKGEQESEEVAAAILAEEAADFGGNFSGRALKGFSHGSFGTVPYLCGSIETALNKGFPGEPIPELPYTLVPILLEFFHKSGL